MSDKPTWTGIPLAVRVAVERYANAKTNLSWIGAADPESHAEIEGEYEKAAAKLKVTLKRYLKETA